MKEINMNETARRTLKTLPDFEQILQEIRLAHLTQDQDKLDALFTKFYDAVMCDSDSCYHIQQTAFRTLVLTQYKKIERRVKISCESFEDVMQSVMEGIYNGSLFFRSLDKLEGAARDARLAVIMTKSCWLQVNDFICAKNSGAEVNPKLRGDLGLLKGRVVSKKDGKRYYHYAQTRSILAYIKDKQEEVA
ncbi:MAG TPA: hypothetical protein DGH14_10765 [Roseburia sp.]|nr:hypothetical protein [Roseburia sp.]